MGDMALIGRLHPLLVHFPIGLVLIAAVAEVVAMTTGLWDWRAVAVGNLRAGAVFGAALATACARGRSPFALWVYRITLFWAAALVAVTSHLGGLLVWGADFLRP